ncbi:MAG TPA: hypothetical protein VGL97_06155 [Bryobacteraceae bacterium]
MTNRELRTRRRAEERKVRKLERKLETISVPSQADPEPVPEIGFVSQKPPCDARRAEINRRNAQNSTGPRTSEGKRASSGNATKHGLADGQLIVAGEDAAAFEALQSALLGEHSPANTTEELLVIEMAQSHWLTQRAIRLQNGCFTPDGVDAKGLALFLRYQTTHQRAFHKALSALLALQKARRKTEVGFVSQNQPRAASRTGFVSQNWPSEPDRDGFVSQNRPEPHSPEVASALQAA